VNSLNPNLIVLPSRPRLTSRLSISMRGQEAVSTPTPSTDQMVRTQGYDRCGSRSLDNGGSRMGYSTKSALNFCAEPKMLTSTLRRLRFPIFAIALATAAWSSCQSIDSFRTKPASPNAVRTNELPQPPTFTSPNVSLNAFVGCGRGRVMDPQTQACRGPADIRSVAP